MIWLKAVAVVGLLSALVLLGLVLALDNHALISLRLLNLETPQLPVFWWLYAAFLAGALVALALCSFALVRRRLGERQAKRALAECQRELAGLKDAKQGRVEASAPKTPL